MARLFRNKLRAKLATINGETLVETLVAALIMALVMLMLCTAIVSAAKVNASARDTGTSFNQGAAAGSAEEVKSIEVSVSIVHVDRPATSVAVSGNSQNGYIYYAASSN